LFLPLLLFSPFIVSSPIPRVFVFPFSRLTALAYAIVPLPFRSDFLKSCHSGPSRQRYRKGTRSRGYKELRKGATIPAGGPKRSPKPEATDLIAFVFVFIFFPRF
jgi:hypothetical protein